MNKPSHAKDLSINLQDEDRKRKEEYQEEVHSRMEQRLKSYNDTVEHGRATIERTMAEANRAVKALTIESAARQWVLGGAILIGIWSAHWIGMKWTEDQVKTLAGRKAALQAEIEAQEKTIKRLKDKTWGVALHEDEEGRFVVFPKGEFGKEWDSWTFRGRPAWKLQNQ